MTLRKLGTWIPAVLTVGALLVITERPGWAKGGIVVTTGSTQQTGDPSYTYVFTAELLAGSALPNGGFFTIYDLPFLTAGALTTQPNSSWIGSVQDVGRTPTGALVQDSANIPNVTWQWNGIQSIIAPANSDYLLGTFTVGPTPELPSPPVVTTVYASSLNGTSASNEGLVFISSVPEPSSVMLLSAGLGTTLPVYWLRRQRHWLKATADAFAA